MVRTSSFTSKINNLDQFYDKYGIKHLNHPVMNTHQLHANDSSSNHDELLWNLLEGQSTSGRDNGVFINLLKGDYNYTRWQNMQEKP